MSEPIYDSACDFCAIARGTDRPDGLICAGETWLAFFPLNPATPGHTLVIPRTHVADLWSLGSDLQPDLMAAVVEIGRAVDRALSPEGMNLITSSGEAAEQTVFHLHLHVVPRWRRDGFGRIWPRDDHYEDEALGDVAERIRAELEPHP